MGAGHRFHPSVLREYDIRGIIGETLLSDDAYAVGRAFGTAVVRQGGTKTCVGYDGRLSSPELESAVINGLTEAGLEVWRVGLGPSPMLYFAVHLLGADGGLMVTGSHNPPSYNGFKMVLGKAASFFGDDIRRLGEIALTGDYATGAGSVAERPAIDDYVARLAGDYAGRRELTVAWDAGNGAVGEVMTRLTARLPGRHLLLNAEIDGRFPNHHPDPTVPANLAQLCDTVARESCDLGIAFDGDGDRIGMIDERGRILWGDQLMILLAGEVLDVNPGATIIADVKASQVLFDEIARLGGTPLMWRTGHSLIKAKMAATGAPLAGEMSGHIFIGDRYYGFDDALYAAVRLMGIVSRAEDTLGAMRDAMPQTCNTPELRFPCPDERKFEVIDEVRARLRETGSELTEIDGVRVRTDDGWWLLRASNTQDVLVARCESDTTAGLDRLKAALVSAIRDSGVEPPEM